MPSVVSIVLLCSLFSCSLSENKKSYISYLEEADRSLATGDFNDVVKTLKKAARSASSPYSYIGIYKRYMVLREYDKAEKIIEDGIKKFPESLELCAVYGNFLLRQGRIQEALENSEILAGTKFGSIYSEAFLKSGDSKNTDGFLAAEFVPVFTDAYNSTGEEKWLVNAALPSLLSGNYSEAAHFQKEITGGEQAFFWAQVHFDAGNYDLCVKNLDAAKNVSNSRKKAETEAVLLYSDACVNLQDFNAAEKARAELLDYAQSNGNVSVPQEVFVNSAIWSFYRDDYARAYDLLMSAVMSDENFVPALLTYGKFARETSRAVEESALDASVRKTGLKTIDMETFDARPKFSMNDAVFRIDRAISESKEKNGYADGRLLVEKAVLFNEENKEIPQKSFEAFLWKMMEENSHGKFLYPTEFVNFAVRKLIQFDEKDDAEKLFTDYLDAKYKMLPEYTEKDESEANGGRARFDIFGGEKKVFKQEIPENIKKAAFGDRAALYAGEMEIWEIEYAAYFALCAENIAAARRLYEFVLFETGGLSVADIKVPVTRISPVASVSSAVNLAEIYAATGEIKKSSSLYTIAAGKERNNVRKSKILYKNAVVQLELGMERDAKFSLDYAVTVDPSNAEARLLKRKIEN